ncbi:MAG: TetR family transcriptional regulator [Actinomycetota bacterium]
MSSESAYGDAETRRRILDAARRLLSERGATVRLSDVAERAGVSRQALYLHFDGRSGLFVALVQHMDETLELGASVEQVFAAPDGEELLTRLVRLNATFWAAVDPVAQVLEAGRHVDEAMRAAWDDRMAQRRAIFGAVVDRLAGSGELAAAWHPDDAAAVLYAAAHYDGWRELLARFGWSEERYVDALSLQLRRSLLV